MTDTPKKAKTYKATLKGDPVDVKLPSGRLLIDVDRGQTIDVDEVDAAALYALPTWSVAGYTPPPDEDEPAGDDPPATPEEKS